MTVLKASQAEYNLLNNFQNGNNLLQFFKDKNGNWVVDTNVLNDPAFDEIKTDLEALEVIAFEPKQTEL